MKILLLTTCFLFFSINFFSQTDSNKNYRYPEFVGGKAAFYKYLDKYFVFPAIEREKGIKSANLEATIYISKEGKVKFVNVSGQNVEFKSQVKKILTLMPDWKPAIFNELPVDTFINQKIWFTSGDSRIKKDTTIYEYRVYEKSMTDEEVSNWEKERQSKAEKLVTAKEFYNKGAKAFNLGNFSEAATLFNQAKLNGLESIDLYFNLAVAQLKSGDEQNACSNFKEAARKGDQEAYNLYMKTCK